MEPQDTRAEPEVRSSLSTTGSRRHAMRLIRDEYDDIVLVYELTGAREGDPRMLVIESGGKSVTKLPHYPPNWRQLRDSDLLALRTQDA